MEAVFSELHGLLTQTTKVVLFQYFLILTCILQKRKDHEALKMRHEKAAACFEGQADLSRSGEFLGLLQMRGCFGCGHRSFPVPVILRQTGSALGVPQLLVIILLLVGRIFRCSSGSSCVRTCYEMG